MPVGMIDTQAIRRRWNDVGSKLDERRRRLFAHPPKQLNRFLGLRAAVI